MAAHGRIVGHAVTYDQTERCWRYDGDGERVDGEPLRECTMCGLQPVPVPIPDFLMSDRIREGLASHHPEYAYDDNGRACFRLDPCIVAAVQALWDAGIKTLGCCCGHGSGHGVISIATEGGG